MFSTLSNLVLILLSISFFTFEIVLLIEVTFDVNSFCTFSIFSLFSESKVSTLESKSVIEALTASLLALTVSDNELIDLQFDKALSLFK